LSSNGGRPRTGCEGWSASNRQSRQSGSTALFQLATDLPAALLARMLGIHISVAVAWQRASRGDWTTYAAEISHRTPSTLRGQIGPCG
jgi:hypothetical protein